jgi:hypothetical protein
MQAIKRNNPGKKRAALIVAFLLVAGLGATGYAYSAGLGPFEKQTAQNSGTTDPRSNEGLTDEELGVKPATSDDPTSESSKTNDSNDDAGDSSVEITIAQINGDSFRVRTLLGDVSSQGSCTLNMESTAGDTYSTSVGVQAMASSSTCKGFDIPLSELSSGTWTVEVVYKNSSESSSASKEVVINV